MNYECIDIHGWHQLKEATKGSREKQWVLKPLTKQSPDEVEIFLFKESSKRYPAEFWAEIIASEVGKIVGVPTPETHCAKWGDKYAALIKFFLKMEWNDKDKRFQQVEVLFEGGDIITGMDPTFDRKEGERHNIFQVERIFSMIKKEQLFKEFLRMLIFDALIGNTDRHQDNWGFVGDNETHKLHLAPAFDNSTSLGSELVEEKLSGYLVQNEVRLRQYISKGKAHVRWSVNGTDLIRLNHFELLKNIAQQKLFLADDIKEMTRFTDEQIEALLDGVAKIEIENPKYRLSETRRNLIKKIICLRRDLLKEEFQLQ
ncbi:MAG: hypothetical protein A3G87_10190 [Omnitrophica bacterium RIFCSPLOWO2_12_FULL_50_11]|nr:MAG: hypothetical protein A3G87_10190 [Omnitrophica bacterium RIFCSPLOWO2_12_FULL_50_11]